MSSQSKISQHDAGQGRADPDVVDRDPLRPFTGVVTGSLLGSAIWLVLIVFAFSG